MSINSLYGEISRVEEASVVTDDKKRHHYDEAFKRQAVKTLIESNKPVAAIAKTLGIDRTNLHKWREKYGFEFEKEPVSSPPGKVVRLNEFLSLKKEIRQMKTTVENLRNIVKRSFKARYLDEE
jgi:transposase-like protein